MNEEISLGFSRLSEIFLFCIGRVLKFSCFNIQNKLYYIVIRDENRR